ncbi:MAG: peptidase M23 [Bacteroidia bacterium]|nr:MAG: peptidase M23 [Bacteroidia bacterium]
MITYKELMAVRDAFCPIFNPDLTPDNTFILDLSGKNEEIMDLLPDDSHELESHIRSVMEALQARYAYGGYMEDREVYRRSKLFAGRGDRARSIHLGIDVWAPERTFVHLPFDGLIHSFQNNDTFGDYGPTIIVQHRLNQKDFFTLYGHLSVDSLDGLEAGMPVKAGNVLGRLGNPSENGSWPSHLHFQIITDMLGKRGDFPGVAFREEMTEYKKLCPDPAVFFTGLFVNLA